MSYFVPDDCVYIFPNAILGFKISGELSTTFSSISGSSCIDIVRTSRPTKGVNMCNIVALDKRSLQIPKTKTKAPSQVIDGKGQRQSS